jgi:hypothetical protein
MPNRYKVVLKDNDVQYIVKVWAPDPEGAAEEAHKQVTDALVTKIIEL